MGIPQTISLTDDGVIRVAQITDTHILEAPGDAFMGVDTHASLAAVIAAIGKLKPGPNLVLVTGDLVHDPSAAAYRRLAALLGELQTPVCCLPGNHDDPTLMRELLNLGFINTPRLVNSKAWQILLLDSHLTGRHSGRLSASELGFLSTTLNEDSPSNRLIALHHHPTRIDCVWMDNMMLENAAEFWTVVECRPSVRGVVWGHIHQEYQGRRGYINLYGTPSTCAQFKPSTLLPVRDDLPPAYRLLELHPDGRIETSVRWLDVCLI
jgi:Icc protein